MNLRVRGGRSGFIMAMALLLALVLAIFVMALLEAAPLAARQNELAREAGQLHDLCRSGLAAAEHQLLLAPAWRAGLAPTGYGAGTYSVAVTGTATGAILTCAAQDAAGRRRTIERQLALGSAAFQYLVYSAGAVTINLGGASPIFGDLYGRLGVNVVRGNFVGSSETLAGGAPDVRLPVVDWAAYQSAYGFDETWPGGSTLTGDHSAARIVFVNGNVTLDQSAEPFVFRTLIVNGNITVTGKVPAKFKTASQIIPQALDASRDFPAILCTGSLQDSGAAPTPYVVQGLVWATGSVTLRQLELTGALLAGGDVSLSGNGGSLQKGALLRDPLTCPPFFTPSAFGLFLVRARERIVW